MEGSSFDEAQFFKAIAASGARALLIGRRALAALGLPVLTADYDYWIHGDDIEAFNRALRPFDLRPNRGAVEARKAGRYVLENDEHVDVMVARSVWTRDGVEAAFDGLWERRRVQTLAPGITLAIPQIDDLILTKRLGGRAKDIDDIRLLEALRRGETGKP